MKKGTLLFTLAATAALLTMSSVARAAAFSPELVNPVDTFSFDISGFNAAGTVGYLLTPDETTTFGTTQTFTAAGINGQDISVTSSETTGATTTTDSVTVSTPTNFLTTNKVSGTTIGQLQLDLGDANAGANTIDYLLPIPAGYTQAGNILYGSANTNFTLSTFGTVLTNSNMSLATAEGVAATGIYSLGVHSFTYSITYATVSLVPEPSSLVLGSLGLLGCAVAIMRRRLAA